MGMLINAAVVVLAGLAGAFAQAPAAQAPAGNARDGQALYMKIGCYQCHGGEGQGGAAGPRLAPAPMLAYRAFVTYIRAPRAEMPPYTAKVISDQQVADIYAFLAARPRPATLQSIPLLNTP